LISITERILDILFPLDFSFLKSKNKQTEIKLTKKSKNKFK